MDCSIGILTTDVCTRINDKAQRGNRLLFKGRSSPGPVSPVEHNRVAICVDGNAGDLAQPLGCVLCRPVRNWVQMGGLEILALANVCKEEKG